MEDHSTIEAPRLCLSSKSLPTHSRTRRTRGLHPLAHPWGADAGGDPAVGLEGALGAGVDPVLKGGQIGQGPEQQTRQ